MSNENGSPHIKITLPIALIISGIIFAGSIVSGLLNASKDYSTLKERIIAVEALAAQQYKFVDTNEGRLTVIETAFKGLCDVVKELRDDYRKMREDQIAFYKEQRSHNKRALNNG